MAVDNDPVIKQFREQISDIDLKTLELINKRIKLVTQLWTYKHEQHVEVYEPAREDWLVTYAARANRGPLSTEALSEIYRHIIEVTQHEARGVLRPAATELAAAEPAPDETAATTPKA
jgi:chorismate mutase